MASENSPLSDWETMDAAALANRKNKANHQYSERVAVPLKSAYFDKQVVIAS